MTACTRCGKPHDGPHKVCESCLAKLRAKWPTSRKRTRRAAMDRLHLCHECGNTAVPGTKHCARCLEVFSERSAATRAKRKAEGLCIFCGKERAPGRTTCPTCLERDRLKAEKKRLARRFKTAIAA